jgi:2-polyprenyl-3-methyl-5-hydroxy-6-metoxy-1,4-benzoquinol methylase
VKSYYHAHESAYRRIKEKGYVGWGDVKSLADLGNEQTKNYLKSTVANLFPDPNGKTALDLGCGTGTTAFVLAMLGFEVTGIDISATAIEMGRGLAHLQSLEVKFLVGDILDLEALDKEFDLIYDSHCLHCIVFEEDRKRVLTGVKNSLTPSGIFILDTMVIPDAPFDPTLGLETLRLDNEYILWHKTAPSTDRGIMKMDGQYWCAQRRIYPPEIVMTEVQAAGLEIQSQRLDAQESKSSMLRLVLK